MENNSGRSWSWLAALLLAVCVGVAGGARAEDVPRPSDMQQVSTASRLMEYLQNQRITMDLKNADLDNVLRIIADQYHVNIVAGEAVEGKVTVSFNEATLEGALKSVLMANGYSFIVDGNILRVAKSQTIADEQKLRKETIDSEELGTEVFFLKYLDATDVKKVIDPLLTKRGQSTAVLRKGFKGFQFGQISALGGQGQGGTGSSVSGGTSSGTSGGSGTGVGSSPSAGTGLVKSGQGGEKSTILVVQDVPSTISLVKSIIKEIDIEPRQILIQSRMFEINADDLRDLGVSFATGSSGLTSTASPPITAVPMEKQDLGVPPVVRTLWQGGALARFFNTSGDGVFGRDGQGGMQMRLQKLTGAQSDAFIAAIESNTDFNELSGPRIMVLENQEAAILVGEQYPIFQTTAPNIAQASTVESLSYFQPVGISLQVIPQIVGDDMINMVIHPSVSAIAGLVTGSTGLQAPRISIREADTQVLIDHAETLVIGGLLQDKNKDTVVGIPFLMDMPLLGNLFKRKKTTVSKIELVIFITPTIVVNNEFTDREKVVFDKTKEKEAVQSTNPWDVIGRKMREQFLQ